MRVLFQESKTLFRLVYPMIISSLGSITLGLIDTAFIGRLGGASLAAVSVAVAIYSVITTVLSASTTGVRILMARSYGAEDSKAMKTILVLGCFFSFPLAGIGFFSLFFRPSHCPV